MDSLPFGICSYLKEDYVERDWLPNDTWFNTDDTAQSESVTIKDNNITDLDWWILWDLLSRWLLYGMMQDGDGSQDATEDA